MTAIRKFGWIEDKYDERDFEFSVPKALLRKLPSEGNVITYCPEIYQQGNIGSCVGNAVAAQIATGHIIQGLIDPQPSRLMIYYNAREMRGSTQVDAGCSLRDAIKSVAKLGVCPESKWPYIESYFAIKPPKSCYDSAIKDKIISYHRLWYSLNNMKACITAGYPFSIGIRVYENFPMELGDIPMPLGGMIGGHAMMVVGYRDSIKRFIVRNSWGKEWGTNGYGTIPYSYIINPKLSVDFWTIRMVQ
jgi:C1A family cysteine protease